MSELENAVEAGLAVHKVPNTPLPSCIVSLQAPVDLFLTPFDDKNKSTVLERSPLNYLKPIGEKWQ
jgi:hypothetical protein